jgi:hypothetical protein
MEAQASISGVMPRRKSSCKMPHARGSSDTVDRLRKALDITDEALRQLRADKPKKKATPRTKSH